MVDRSARLASRQDPSPMQRRVGSRVVSFLVSPGRRAAARRLQELRRRLSGAPHRVEVFHQADDPYSHLLSQVLGALERAYEIELVIHLVGRNEGANNPEPELLAAFARRDAAATAPHRGLHFRDPGHAPPPEAVQLAERLLQAAIEDGSFTRRAPEIGEALWSGDKSLLETLASAHPLAEEDVTRRALEAGSERRRRRRHYSGAMLLYGGEWYWGIDRIDHLEARLQALGAARSDATVPVAPRPAIESGPLRDEGRITLEFFPSLRSPYTAAVTERTLALAEETGVELVLRPVLPMVMRGVPATPVKGVYIFTDAGREAELLGADYGRFFDPIGTPVERGYSLFPYAQTRGLGGALIASFLRAAFAEGIDTGSDEGIRRVAERAGLDWSEAQAHLDRDDWREELEANRLVMVEELGLWGVPSYRVSGPEGEPDLATWGQDRLWLVGREIQRRIGLTRGS